MHTDEARKLGETDQRMHALSAWQESPLFSEIERCVLAVTDEVTLIASGGLSPKTYAKALELLGESQLAQCLMQIVTINAWNRIAVSTKLVYE
jgi:alkylhydroperoxidase family enzyme